MLPRRRLLALLLTLCVVAPSPAQDRGLDLAPPGSLISVQLGESPIIISAPHGGRVRIPGAVERTKGVKVLDTNTAQVALLMSQRLTERMGRRPSFVVAHFSRKDADCNRAPEAEQDDEAYASDAAKACYDAYHGALRAAVDRSRATFGLRVLLVDVHGQARMPEAIVRGTRQGAAMAHLVTEHGPDVIDGPRSVFGVLEAKGYVVEPPLRSRAATEGSAPAMPLRERFFAGGWITERYGAAREDGVNALQLEIGRMRVDSLEKTARDLADAIAEFAFAYLGAEPPPPVRGPSPDEGDGGAAPDGDAAEQPKKGSGT